MEPGKQLGREEYITLLQKKAEELGRIPQKADFETQDMARMKSFWGPWPHVLAAAGLIPSKQQEKDEKKKLRKARIKAEKQAKNEAMKEAE